MEISRQGKIYFAGFLLLQFCSLTRRLFEESFGPTVNTFGAVCSAASVPLIILAAFTYSHAGRSQLEPRAKVWLFLLIGICGLQSVAGFYLYELERREVILDMCAFSILISSVVLGSNLGVWQDAKNIIFWVFVAAVLTNGIGLLGFSEIGVDLSDRVARDVVSYRTQQTLDLLPLLLITFFARPLWQQVAITGGWWFAFGQQVMFQKRIETVYLVVLALAGAWVLRYSMRNNPGNGGSQPFRRYAALFAICGILSFLAILTLNPLYMTGQATGLIRRFSGQSDVEYSEGFLKYVLLENERFMIVTDCLKTFTFKDWLVGRGFGGGVEWIGFDFRMLDTSMGENIWESQFLEEYNFFGRRGFEVGMATPLLKGGLVLWLTLYAGYFQAFWRAPSLLSSTLSRGALGVVIILFGYKVFAGDLTPSLSFQMTCDGMCLGWCLSRNSTRSALPNV